MSWKKIIKEEEEELPEHVKRARERVKQGLPSQEMPLIPQFKDKTVNKQEPDPEKVVGYKMIGEKKVPVNAYGTVPVSTHNEILDEIEKLKAEIKEIESRR